MTSPTDQQLDACLDAIEAAAHLEYPPATLQIHGRPDRRAMLRLVLLQWLIDVQPEAHR